MKVKIIDMTGYSGKDFSEDFAKFGLKLGDEIEVNKFVSNAHYYQPVKGGDVLFMYRHNAKPIN